MFLNYYLISICQLGNSNHFFNHCYALQYQLLSITALENRGKYKFLLTNWSFWYTLLD